MKIARLILGCVLMTAAAAAAQRSYVGFDKNGFPGDDLLASLHRSFAFTGYWLNNPPGMTVNPWAGKRGVVRVAGFGFLILFNGRLDAQLKNQDAAALGRNDAAEAVAAAKREGFPAGAVIFLDEEEGGALLAEQAAYIGAWIAGVQNAGFGVGVYCSGIAVPAGMKMVATAQDVEARFPTAKIWVWDDRCPPAPGCVRKAMDPAKSGYGHALVWQYALSPRRPGDTRACAATYASDQQCYAPGLSHSGQSFIDMNVSRSEDPSRGR